MLVHCRVGEDSRVFSLPVTAARGFISKLDLLIRSRKPKCRSCKDLGFLGNGIKNKNQGNSKTGRQTHRGGKKTEIKTEENKVNWGRHQTN